MRWVQRHIAAMCDIARNGARSPVVVGCAADLGFLPANIERWVESRFVHAPDPISEVILAPEKLISDAVFEEYACGDADDIATAVAALGLAAGLDVQYVVVGLEGRELPSHVYARLKRPEEEWREPADHASPTWSKIFPVEPEK